MKSCLVDAGRCEKKRKTQRDLQISGVTAKNDEERTKTLDPDTSSSTCPSLKVDSSSTPSYDHVVTGRHPLITRALLCPSPLAGKHNYFRRGPLLCRIAEDLGGRRGIPPVRKREAGHTSTKKRRDEGRAQLVATRWLGEGQRS